MPTFVDFAGMNTLVSSSFDDTNTITSEKNGDYTSEFIPDEQELVGINLHRNGPYGYSTWRQLRVSENPLTRHHRETNKMTFVIQPGPVTNVLSNGELRVRSRYSSVTDCLFLPSLMLFRKHSGRTWFRKASLQRTRTGNFWIQ